MLHPSIGTSYDSEKKRFRRIISLWFSAAGMYWLAMYGAELLGVITVEEMHTLRNGQTVIYFILLTVWGLEYLRESRRLAIVIAEANGKRLAPNQVTAQDVASRLHWFGILKPTGAGRGAAIMPSLNILGLLVSFVLIVAQYWRLVSSSLN